MKLYITHFFYIFLVFACSSSLEKKLHSHNMSLLTEIIEEHDSVMKNMSLITSLENQLLNIKTKDSLIFLSIKELKDSHGSMMNFMKNFSDQFPYDSYPMNRKFEKENIDYYQNLNNKLIIEQKKILLVAKQFDEAIDKAQKLLN